MRPISLFIASSLDGFITGPNDSLEWLFTDQDYGYTAFLDTIDAAIMHGSQDIRPGLHF